MKAIISQFVLKERSGVEIVSATGRMVSNDKVLRVPSLKLETRNGNTITTGKIITSDKECYLDLDGNKFRIGDSSSSIDWNVTAKRPVRSPRRSTTAGVTTTRSTTATRSTPKYLRKV